MAFHCRGGTRRGMFRVENLTEQNSAQRGIAMARRCTTTVIFGFILAVATSIAALPAYASSHGVFDLEETSEIERIVGDYIRNNPEIIVDALRQLELRQRQAEAQEVERQIALNSEALLNDPGSPVGGNPNGDVTVVEFFDYRCPYCKAVSPSLSQLLKDDGNIRFVYKEWPILGPVSVIGARVALATRKQGMYGEFHERLMGVAGQLSEAMIFDIAAELGLDIDRLREDMDSPDIEDMLRRNAKLADNLKITGTPAFVIGDVLVPGALELSDLKALVEQARSDG